MVEVHSMKIYVKSSDTNFNPQGLPPKALVMGLKRRYKTDSDEYYGQMFLIPPKDLNYAIEFAAQYGFGIVDDPDNDNWYYLQELED